jgi:hypothetical protein
MSGIKLGEYKNFLHFIKERTPELKDIDIEINYGDDFSVTNILGAYYIDVEDNLTMEIDKFIKRFLADKIDQNIYWMQAYYREFFVLLHEVGHIVTRKLYSDSQKDYTEIKALFQSKVYNNKYEAFLDYRNLTGEKLADQFAIDFTNKYLWEIGVFFNPTETIEILKDFCGTMN